MRYAAAVLSALGTAAGAEAEGKKKEFVWPADKTGKEPIAQRTTPPLHPLVRPAGQPPGCHGWWAKPGLTKHYAAGMIGGGSLKKGHGPGPTDGTYGMDYLPLGWRQYDKILLKFGGGRQDSFLHKYEADGPRLPDPIAAAPFRKAVVEARHEHGSLLHYTPSKGEGGH